MSGVTTDIVEQLLSYSNDIICMKDTIANVQNSDTLVVSNIENGITEEELYEPLQYLFSMSMKKEYCDVQYVGQDKEELQINIGDNCNDINVYDLETFLLAIRPNQFSLIETVGELCNTNLDFLNLTDKLHLLNTYCKRSYCQGRILAYAKFTKNKTDEINFRIAHPPFVYEIDRLLEKVDEQDLNRYLLNLKRYLETPIQNDSCILCLAYDLYCKESSNVKNFRLFFLHKTTVSMSKHESLNLLYETEIQEYSKVDQCFLFDEVLKNIAIVSLLQDGDKRYFLRYRDKGKPILYF